MSESKTKKYYCYVDETGQDTQGEFFIVSVVVTSEERYRLLDLCEKTEKESGKNQIKWAKSRHSIRMDYIKKIINEPEFYGKLCFSIFNDLQKPIDYMDLTIQSITSVIKEKANKPYKATVLIDGLYRIYKRKISQDLRRSGISVRKIV